MRKRMLAAGSAAAEVRKPRSLSQAVHPLVFRTARVVHAVVTLVERSNGDPP